MFRHKFLFDSIHFITFYFCVEYTWHGSSRCEIFIAILLGMFLVGLGRQFWNIKREVICEKKLLLKILTAYNSVEQFVLFQGHSSWNSSTTRNVSVWKKGFKLRICTSNWLFSFFSQTSFNSYIKLSYLFFSVKCFSRRSCLFFLYNFFPSSFCCFFFIKSLYVCVGELSFSLYVLVKVGIYSLLGTQALL